MIFVVFVYLLYHLMPVLSGNFSHVGRRIIGGKETTVNHSFMAYIIKAENSSKTYSGWLCGGVIVGKQVILTSAACVRDVEHMYAIAGYKMYISDEKRSDDACIKNMRKKVIIVCVPKDYNLVYDKLEVWANYDIAAVKVEASMTGVAEYATHCTYVPQMIDINYGDLSMQDVGNDVLILGWGHNSTWRKDQDLTDFNQEKLQYGPTKVYNKTKCIDEYKDYNIDALIKKYMICTWPPGKFDDKGENVGPEGEGVEGCASKENAADGKNGTVQDNPGNVGICQNDHGGPLISWQRAKPKVIGVASVFKLDAENNCSGPFLFTSTYCSSKFLKCVVTEFRRDEPTGRRAIVPPYCSLPPQVKGFEIIERRISWLHHPDGPAETEKYHLRPQKPIRDG